MTDLADDAETITGSSGASSHRSASNSGQTLFLGTLLGFDEETHEPLVGLGHEDTGERYRALTVVELTALQIGQRIALMFESRHGRPVIMGLICPPVVKPFAPSPFTLESNGERLIVTATNELVLRCGEATITLTKAGKVVIRGAYVSSSSAGVNRLKGASIQIN